VELCRVANGQTDINIAATEPNLKYSTCERKSFFLNNNKDWTKVKIKLTLEQATKSHRGSRSIAVLFL